MLHFYENMKNIFSSKGVGMGSIGVGVEVKAPQLPHDGWSAFKFEVGSGLTLPCVCAIGMARDAPGPKKRRMGC